MSTTRMHRTALLALIVSFLTILASLAATPASATSGLTTGAGYTTSYGRVGNFLNNGLRFYCTTPALALTKSQTAHEVAVVTGLSTTISQELAYVLNRHGNTSDNNVAAAVSQALNSFAGNAVAVHNRSTQLPAVVNQMTASFIREAQLYHGPYVVSPRFGSTPYIGKTGIVTIQVMSASRHAVPRIAVRLTGTNLSVGSSLHTDAFGVGRVGFTATGLGVKNLTATAIGLAPVTVLEGYNAAGQQRLLASSGSVALTARSTYQSTANGTSVSYGCTTECKGTPTATFVLHNVTGAPAQYVVSDNGQPFKTTAVPAGTSSTVNLTLQDAHSYTTQVRYLVNGTWTALQLLNTTVVDCPPVPVLTEQLALTCNTSVLTLSLPLNDTAHAQEIILNGTTVATAKTGETASYSVSYPCGTHPMVSFVAGVQRDNQQWNLGNVVTMTLA